ncbi:hypothetical protein MRB53_023170 [Persea americana]|uniref:Uncharacterized protein n=1 Tax=Persea americana TaxID=3435 RepID=A0ACC2L8N9_PERAE|nr:hypothetical protein MRB53_023170 [Persea americana]
MMGETAQGKKTTTDSDKLFPLFFVEEEKKRGRVRSKLRRRGWPEMMGEMRNKKMKWELWSIERGDDSNQWQDAPLPHKFDRLGGVKRYWKFDMNDKLNSEFCVDPHLKREETVLEKRA